MCQPHGIVTCTQGLTSFDLRLAARNPLLAAAFKAAVGGVDSMEPRPRRDSA